MLIKRLDIQGVRNINNASLSPLSDINILYGDNGAGKTSVLEAINLLSTAKSFRSHKIKTVIADTSASCVIFGEVELSGLGYQPLGIERSRLPGNSGEMRVSGKSIKSASILAENLPVQVMSADTFRLLEGSPSVRRQFIDWGVFHVEHRFHSVWKNFQRCLKHRNSLLRSGRIGDGQLSVWTKELEELGTQLDGFRRDYVERLIPVFNTILSELLSLTGIEVRYYRGWDKERNYADVLAANLLRDEDHGFTQAGPHRADLKIRIGVNNAADILSRGQQKLVVCALRVAQGYLMAQTNSKKCVFLVDDLPAELDFEHRRSLCKLLEGMDCQVFVSCVEPNDLEGCWSDQAQVAMFHVEHGEISRLSD